MQYDCPVKHERRVICHFVCVGSRCDRYHGRYRIQAKWKNVYVEERWLLVTIAESLGAMDVNLSCTKWQQMCFYGLSPQNLRKTEIVFHSGKLQNFPVWFVGRSVSA